MTNASHVVFAVAVIACLGCVPGMAPVYDQPPIAVSTSLPLDGVTEHFTIHNISSGSLTNVRVVGKRISDSTTGSTTPIPTLPANNILDVPWT